MRRNLLAILCLVFLLAVAHPADGASISVGAVYVAGPGSVLQIPVTVYSGTADIAGANIRVEFDAEALTDPSVLRGALLSSSSHKLSWSAPTTGSLCVAAWAPPGAPAFGGRSGTVFTIQLKVSARARRGEAYLIRFSSLGPGNLAASGLCAASGGALAHAENEGLAVYPQYAPVGVSGVSKSGYGVGALLPGSKVYNSGSDVFVSPVADSLLGQPYLLTSQADKDATGSAFLQFDTDQKAVVYVALDSRIASPPSWLNGWSKQTLRLATTQAAGYERVVYSKAFAKGKVTLGGNRDAGMATGRNMYSVVVVPDVTEAGSWCLYGE